MNIRYLQFAWIFFALTYANNSFGQGTSSCVVSFSDALALCQESSKSNPSTVKLQLDVVTYLSSSMDGRSAKRVLAKSLRGHGPAFATPGKFEHSPNCCEFSNSSKNSKIKVMVECVPENMKQTSFFKSKDFPTEFGGELLQKKRKCKRPLSTKKPVHEVLRADITESGSLTKYRKLINETFNHYCTKI